MQNPELKQYLDGVLSLLDTTPADKTLLTRILSSEAAIDRAGLVAKISDGGLRGRLTTLLPEIEQAARRRHAALAVAKEVEGVGGKVVWTPAGPQWLYLATGDEGVEIFDVITTVDLYNGNNPLKGKGGRNEQVTDQWLELAFRSDDFAAVGRRKLCNSRPRTAAHRRVDGAARTQSHTDSGDRRRVETSRRADRTSKAWAGFDAVRRNRLCHLKSLTKLEDVNFHFTRSAMPVSEQSRRFRFLVVSGLLTQNSATRERAAWPR